MSNEIASQALTLSQTLARHVASTQYEDLPRAAVQASKRLMLDTLAVGWAGSDAQGVAEVRQLFVPSGSSGPTPGASSNVWGTHQFASALDAALINSGAAAALDYDSLQIDALLHSQIVTLPALLAVAQQQHASGRDLLTALTLADDVGCRLGSSAKVPGRWFFTSIFGVFAAAAGSARLLGLDERGIGNALGTALFQAGGTQQSMVERTLTKRFMGALAARAGVFSALLAKGGMVAPTQTLEGQFGLFNLYVDCDAGKLLDGLGERYDTMHTVIKKYPSCGCSHALTEAALQLVREHSLQPGVVLGATAKVTGFMARTVGASFSPTQADAQVQGQFSAQYAVATALFRGGFGMDDITPPRVLDAAVGPFARKVRIEIDANNDGQLAPATVTFELRSGQRLTRRVEAFPGDTAATISPASLKAKAHDCMRFGAAPLAPHQVDRLVERIEDLESLADCAELFTLDN